MSREDAGWQVYLDDSRKNFLVIAKGVLSLGMKDVELRLSCTILFLFSFESEALVLS